MTVSCAVYIYTICVYWSRHRELLSQDINRWKLIAPKYESPSDAQRRVIAIRLTTKIRSRHDFRYKYGCLEISQGDARGDAEMRR